MGYKKETLVASTISGLIGNIINFLIANCSQIVEDETAEVGGVIINNSAGQERFRLAFEIGDDDRKIDFKPSSYNGTVFNTYSFAARPWASSADFRVTITLACNDNCIDIKIRDYGAPAMVYFHGDILFMFSETGCLYAAGYTTSDTDYPYALAQTAWFSQSNSASLTAVKRLPYTYSDSSATIEMINGKTFANGGIRKVQIDKVYDASTVNADQVYPIGENQFYSLDSNTLMECGTISN